MRLLRYYQKSMVWNFSDFMHEVFGPKRGLKWVPNEVFKLIVKNQCMELFMEFFEKRPPNEHKIWFFKFHGEWKHEVFLYFRMNIYQHKLLSAIIFLFVYLFIFCLRKIVWVLGCNHLN